MNRLLIIVFISAGLSASAAAQSNADRSPFLPPNGTPAGRGSRGPAETYELAGASATDSGSAICLYNTTTKHSRWLSVGETDGDLQVLSYDPNSEQAVVRFDGRIHQMSLRATRTASAGPTFSPSTLAAVPAGSSLAANQPLFDPSTAGKTAEQIKQERDARMLVSDLLEISIRQRKAYEEAQKRANSARPNGNPTAP
ncbi:MAG TPA: hypothetical protein VGL42_07675 [Opitutaceae bacterium]